MEFVRTMFLPSPHDAFKHPGWRWRRCGYLLQHRRPPVSGLDDGSTREGWSFRRALLDCRDDAERGQLALDFPALAQAHRVFTGGPLKRVELEARLLADQTDDAIAAKCGIAAAAVGAYHLTFFEIRPHLSAHSYIVNAVIGPKAHFGLMPEDRDVLLKLVGYGMGGPGVDALLAYFAEPPVVPARLDRLDLAALEKLRSRLRTHMLVLTLTTPAADASPATWLRISEQFAAPRCGSGSGEAVPGPPRPALDVAALLATWAPASVVAAGPDERDAPGFPDLLPLVPQQVAWAVRALAPTARCG
jgi:hypothetical protein